MLSRVTACAELLQGEEAAKKMLSMATGLAESLDTYSTAVSKIMEHLRVS